MCKISTTGRKILKNTNELNTIISIQVGALTVDVDHTVCGGFFVANFKYVVAELIQFHIVDVPYPILADGDPAMGDRVKFRAGCPAVINGDRQPCGFPEAQAGEGRVAEAVACPIVQQVRGEIVHPAVFPHPVLLHMLIGAAIVHAVAQDPVVNRVDLLLVGHGVVHQVLDDLHNLVRGQLLQGLVGLDGLMEGIQAVRLDDDAGAGAAGGMGAVSNSDNSTADAGMDGSGNEACLLGDLLAHLHGVAYADNGVGGSAQVHGQGDDDAFGLGELHQGLVLGGLLALYGVDTAVVAGEAALPDGLDIVIDDLEVDLGVITNLNGLGSQLAQTALCRQTLLDLFPGAVLVRADLALAVLGTAALAVDQALGAVHDGADAAGHVQIALSAGIAGLLGQSHAVMAGVVQGVRGCENGYLGDVGDSVTGDKKAQKFEDDYLEDVFEGLPDTPMKDYYALFIASMAHYNFLTISREFAGLLYVHILNMDMPDIDSTIEKINKFLINKSISQLEDELNAEEYITGGWRSQKPIIDWDKCKQCLLCVPVCPDSCIPVKDMKRGAFDLDHCKGCGICVKSCPFGAITMEGVK